MSKQSGITIVALIITVVVMLILVGITIELGNDVVDKARIEDIKTNMLLIKPKALTIAEQYNFKDIENLVGTKYTEDTQFNKSNLNSIFSGFTEEQKDNLYIWTQDDLNNQGLNTIKVDRDNFYVINYNMENFEIYYSNKIEGKFSLSELNV